MFLDSLSTGNWRSVGVIILPLPLHLFPLMFLDCFSTGDWRLATGDWLRVRTSLSFSVLFILYPIFRVFAEFSRFDVALPQAEKVGK